MSEFYFFTDIDLLNSQPLGNEFGPAGVSGGNDNYQVTSRHTATANPSAYAVCDGIVFIQQVTGNSNLVNLILKPTQQPPFAFSKIKFFIYRSIKIDSLIDSNGTDIAPKDTNDLTKSLWKSQIAKNKSANTPNDKPPKEALGINLISNVPGFADLDPIDNVFYRTSVDFQLPVVNSGWRIGKFDSNGFGFEIMLESIGFEPILSKVRNNVNIVSVASLGTNPTQPDFFEHWHDKEEILNYLDPAAYFGMFYHHKLKLQKSGGGKEKVNNDELYDKLLKGNHSGTDANFFNCNLIYLDIRNEFNFSFNYFKNYDTDIKIAFDDNSALTSKDYYSNNWPLLTISNFDFPSNTSISKNILRISMPDGNGDNPLPTFYISSGILSSSYPKEPKEKNKLIDLEVINGFTDELKLATDNRKNLSDTTCVSSYIKLKYFKRFDGSSQPPVSSGTVIRAGNYLDGLFAPFSMKIPFSGAESIKSVLFDEEIFVDLTSELGEILVGKIGIAKDSKMVNLFFTAVNKKNYNDNKSGIPFLLCSEKRNDNKSYIEKLPDRIKGIEVIKFILKLPAIGSNVGYINLKNASKGFTSPNPNDFISIIITNSQFNLLTTLYANFLPKYRVYLKVKNKTEDIDDNSTPYVSAIIALTGFIIDNNDLKVHEEETTIKIFAHASL